jgi:hypothetical protein
MFFYDKDLASLILLPGLGSGIHGLPASVLGWLVDDRAKPGQDDKQWLARRA